MKRFLATVLMAGSMVTVSQSQHGADVATPVHYRVYDSGGNPSTWEALLADAMKSDVVFLGEEHDDPMAHYLEEKLLRDLVENVKTRPVALSLEMFERDVQVVLDEYLAGLITEDHFKKSSRPWSNYDTDYRPMVELAREAGVPVIASNAPRRYVNRVSRLGADSLAALTDRARSWLPPLPFEEASEEYREQWNAQMAESMAEMSARKDTSEAEPDSGSHRHVMHDSSSVGMHRMGEGRHAEMHPAEAEHRVHEGEMPHAHNASDSIWVAHHGEGASDSVRAAHHQAMHGAKAAKHPMIGETDSDQAKMPADTSASAHADSAANRMHAMSGYMLDAQSLWDAAMADAIARHLKKNAGAVVMHAVGGFHVEYGTGIPEHLARYRPGVRQLVVAIRPAGDINAFDPEKHGKRGDYIILTDEALPRTYESRF